MTLLVPYHKIAGRGLSALISDNIPEVQKAARVQLAAAWIQSGNTGFHQTVVVTDENFLNIFWSIIHIIYNNMI